MAPLVFTLLCGEKSATKKHLGHGNEQSAPSALPANGEVLAGIKKKERRTARKQIARRSIPPLTGP